uniref:Uncharacterized protein n=1 Tax=Rhizophora mucronata TaxID=61149 RepID=A0A2P2MLG7_RHIMU
MEKFYQCSVYLPMNVITIAYTSHPNKHRTYDTVRIRLFNTQSIN